MLQAQIPMCRHIFAMSSLVGISRLYDACHQSHNLRKLVKQHRASGGFALMQFIGHGFSLRDAADGPLSCRGFDYEYS
jgi:hypothetical protein